MKSLLFLFVLVTAVNVQAESSRFVNNKFRSQGKWLATLSIGLGVPEEATKALSKVLEKNFLSKQGGYFKEGFLIDDYQDDFSIEKFERQVRLLGQDIRRFKTRNPKEPARLVLGLTGHGMYNANTGEYEFSLGHNAGLSGDEIISRIAQLGADELILFVQSCQSGSLAKDDMAEFVAALNKKISLFSQARNKKILVVTPVNRYINSPIYTWESVVERALSKVSDKNHDKVVSLEEVVNQLLLGAYLSPDHIPIEAFDGRFGSLRSMQHLLPTAGIDPQFFIHNFSPDSPLLLTQMGVAAFLGRKLKAHSLPASKEASKLFADVKKAHKTTMRVIEDIYLYSQGKGSEPKYEDGSLESQKYMYLQGRGYFGWLKPGVDTLIAENNSTDSRKTFSESVKNISKSCVNYLVSLKNRFF